MHDPEVGHTWHDRGTAKETMRAISTGALEVPVRKSVHTLRKRERHRHFFPLTQTRELDSCGLGVCRVLIGFLTLTCDGIKKRVKENGAVCGRQ